MSNLVTHEEYVREIDAAEALVLKVIKRFETNGHPPEHALIHLAAVQMANTKIMSREIKTLRESLYEFRTKQEESPRISR